MSETPTPNKPAASSKPAASGRTAAKRGGLALPPRGQALARLQDLEEETEPVVQENEKRAQEVYEEVSNEGSNAVNTASSNAVNHQGSNSVQTGSEVDRTPMLSPEVAVPPVQTDRPPVATVPQPAVTAPKAAAADYQAPARAAREPTTRITVDMPDSLHQKISVLSAQTRRSIKDLVIEALAATYFGTGTDPQ